MIWIEFFSKSRKNRKFLTTLLKNSKTNKNFLESFGFFTSSSSGSASGTERETKESKNKRKRTVVDE